MVRAILAAARKLREGRMRKTYLMGIRFLFG